MATFNTKLPKIESIEYKDIQFDFSGKWLPDVDAAVLGGNNYAKLENLRYKDKGKEGVSGYSKINTSAIATYVNIKNGFQLKTNYDQDTYVFVHAVDASGNGRLYQNQTAIPDQGNFNSTLYLDTSGNSYRADSSANLTGRFSNAPGGNMCYCNGEESVIYAGKEMRCGAVYTCDTIFMNPKDHTVKANNTLTDAANRFTFDESDQDYLYILSPRPIRGIRFQFQTVNAVAATTLQPYYWSGSAWVEITAGGHSLSDGTASGGISFAQDGWVTWNFVGIPTEKPIHFQELYMYAYIVYINSGAGNASCVIHTITLESPMQSIVDLWDGVYRQPIQCQFYDDSATTTEDYTIHVNTSSDINTPIGLELDGMEGGADKDELYIMFEDQMAAIKFTMLSGLVNNVASVATLYYWDGDSWVDASATNGTIAVAGKTFSGTGMFTWTTPSDEQPQFAYGTTGYMYLIRVSVTLTGVHGDATEEVYADLVTGIPAQKVLPAWKFPVQYKTRIMMANYLSAGEGNRVDYCVSNTSEAWNGYDSSDNGLYSLYFGGREQLTCGTQLYNRYGSNIFATLIMLKENETYLMVGDNADDFRIYPVSFTVGCPAPGTLVTAEVNIAKEDEQPLQRNVAVWLSHRGPVMFDGAMLLPLDGIDSYFDPAETTKAINTDAIKTSRAWYDSIYKEYNLLIPTLDNTSPNKWFVYSFKYKGWFEKKVGTSVFPISGWEVSDEFGAKFCFGGLSTGYMMHLENGTTWDGIGITQKIRTGDIFLTNNNWDECRLRKLKLILRRIDESATLNVRYYSDTAADAGVGVTFMTATLASTTAGGNAVSFTNSTDNNVSWATPTASTVDLSLATGLQRLITSITNLNRTGWAHAFEFDVTTSSSRKGFQPVLWGMRYQIVRKDDTPA